ncbi:hypothetical protein [Microbacterium sp. Leaf179]|uniref:hypothetical protein n=1 Tax=Microbacterium sp. Leaf179 TaxID=1736288 RepID=UPI0006F851FB|nr:hypothetical protein [Microbacterium sp. Leaf179]KQR88738.1 hypothetical protein ASF96_02925 [Microbacterium sp. Leaf179]
MKTITQTAVIHESLRSLFDAPVNFNIRGDGAPAPLPEGHPLWIDQNVHRVEPAEYTDATLYVIRIYDVLTGEPINLGIQMSVQWWMDQVGAFDFGAFGRHDSNAYVTNGRYLFVSGGGWGRLPGTDRFVSWASLRDSNVADEAAEHVVKGRWLASRANLIAEVRPAWADAQETYLDGYGEHVESIVFVRKVGGASIEQWFTVDGDALSCDREGPRICLAGEFCEEGGVFTVEQAATIGVDIIAAAAVLGEHVTVSKLRKTAVTAGVGTGDLLQMTGRLLGGAS